jgi:prophage antirepressor-like protein
MDLSLTYEGKGVRIVGTPEDPQWIASDVCNILGMDTSRSARHVPAAEKGRHILPTLGGPQEVLTLREPGLYRLIFRSNKPEAERFRTWTFNEVLPSIRKTGSYQVPETRLTLVARALVAANEIIVEQAEEIAQKSTLLAIQKPKVEAYSNLAAGDDDRSIEDVARELGYHPYKLLQQKLIDDGFVYEEGGRIKPHQWARREGLFVYKDRYNSKTGWHGLSTLVTPKGALMCAEKYPVNNLPLLKGLDEGVRPVFHKTTKEK